MEIPIEKHDEVRKITSEELLEETKKEAFNELEKDKQKLLRKADNADDEWSYDDLFIAWDAFGGEPDKVKLVVGTSVFDSSIEEAEGHIYSELYEVIMEHGEIWGEKVLDRT